MSGMDSTAIDQGVPAGLISGRVPLRGEKLRPDFPAPRVNRVELPGVNYIGGALHL